MMSSKYPYSGISISSPFGDMRKSHSCACPGPVLAALAICACCWYFAFMEKPACIRMPYMRKEVRYLPEARSLWPGHAGGMPAFAWCPDDYPLDQKSASSFLDSLISLSFQELESMRLSLSKSQYREALRDSDELGALASFSGRPENSGSFGLGRQLAQQLLLWSFMREGLATEARRLERECHEIEVRLQHNFLDDANAPVEASPDLEAEDFTDWKPLVANASFFIDAGQAILAEGQMAADLEDSFELEPVSPQMWGLAIPFGSLCALKAPLWRILGSTRPARGEAARIFNPERAWLVWRRS